MPFLDHFRTKRRIHTDLGYSITCHASMYTGVPPDKHLLWFVWQYAPERSPFRWTTPLKYVPIVDGLAGRYFLTKTTRLFRKNSSFFGIPVMATQPLRYWRYFDVSEDRLWSEPGYSKDYPTVFDLLRDKHVPFEVVGMDRTKSGNESELVASHKVVGNASWLYLFIGDVDVLSHRHRQESDVVTQRLVTIDRILEQKYEEFRRAVGDCDFICWSDHGHTHVDGRVNLGTEFARRGVNLAAYLHMVEANFARFWFRSDGERHKVERVLRELGLGFILTPDLLAKYQLTMPDRRYGDLVFYLDRFNIFAPTVWGFGRGIRSMHGYLPEYPDSDGVFVSNLAADGWEKVRLVDILPSTLAALGVPVPEYVTGRPIWSA